MQSLDTEPRVDNTPDARASLMSEAPTHIIRLSMRQRASADVAAAVAED